MKKICHVLGFLFKGLFIGVFLLWYAITGVIGIMVDTISSQR